MEVPLCGLYLDSYKVIPKRELLWRLWAWFMVFACLILGLSALICGCLRLYLIRVCLSVSECSFVCVCVRACICADARLCLCVCVVVKRTCLASEVAAIIGIARRL